MRRNLFGYTLYLHISCQSFVTIVSPFTVRHWWSGARRFRMHALVVLISLFFHVKADGFSYCEVFQVFSCKILSNLRLNYTT